MTLDVSIVEFVVAAADSPVSSEEQHGQMALILYKMSKYSFLNVLFRVPRTIGLQHEFANPSRYATLASVGLDMTGTYAPNRDMTRNGLQQIRKTIKTIIMVTATCRCIVFLSTDALLDMRLILRACFDTTFMMR